MESFRGNVLLQLCVKITARGLIPNSKTSFVNIIAVSYYITMTSYFMHTRSEGALLKFNVLYAESRVPVKDFTRGSGGMPPKRFVIDSEAIVWYTS